MQWFTILSVQQDWEARDSFQEEILQLEGGRDEDNDPRGFIAEEFSGAGGERTKLHSSVDNTNIRRGTLDHCFKFTDTRPVGSQQEIWFWRRGPRMV